MKNLIASLIIHSVIFSSGTIFAKTGKKSGLVWKALTHHLVL